LDKALPDGGTSSQWTSRSIGSNLQHNIFYAFIKIGGRRAAYGLLSCVALYYALFRQDIRKKAGFYLARRFRNEGLFRNLIHCYRMYENLGKALIDRATIGIKGPQSMTIIFDDQTKIMDLIGEGKGVILLTAHVGCWQATMERLRVFNTPVSLLIHHEEGDIDRHFFEHTGAANPFRIIDPLGYMGGVLEMMEVLRMGELLSIMGDRIFGSDRNTVAVNFLGGKIRLPFSTFKLASATGAPVAVLFSHKSGPDSHELVLDRVIRVPSRVGRKEDAFQPYVAQFAEALELYTEHHPYQFFNFFNMWESSEGAKTDGRSSR
jgi:predicted LPLAT superfamily acyltransferase